jgi:hypothetical protein
MKILMAQARDDERDALQHFARELGDDAVVVGDESRAWQVERCDDAPRLVIFDQTVMVFDSIEVCWLARQAGCSPWPYLVRTREGGEWRSVLSEIDIDLDAFMDQLQDAFECSD